MNNSTRKIYVKPELMVVVIDQEIALVMMTGIPTPDPTDPYDPESAPVAPSSYPFGNGSPDYSGMSKD